MRVTGRGMFHKVGVYLHDVFFTVGDDGKVDAWHNQLQEAVDTEKPGILDPEDRALLRHEIVAQIEWYRGRMEMYSACLKELDRESL